VVTSPRIRSREKSTNDFANYRYWTPETKSEHANLSCGIKFEDTLLNCERLRSIRLASALMPSLCAASQAGNREGVGNERS
jgi:hypothetical protein